MPLPRVSEGNDAALMRSAEDPELIKHIMARLDKDNPVIANMLRGICAEYNDADEQMMPLDKAGGMALMVYRQLESQTEADEMGAVSAAADKELQDINDRHRQDSGGPN